MKMSNILYDALRKYGISYPKEEIVLNRFTRWGDNKKYWAIKFAGGYSIGDFSNDFHENIFEENYDYETCKHEIKAIQKKLAETKKRENEEAALQAKKIWDNAKNCETHPYLETKKVEAYGLKIDGEKLLIPVYDENDNLVSLQEIWENPNKDVEKKFIKKFWKNGKTKCCCFTIGKIDDEVVICEGYATGATIYKCIGKAVVVAFYCGNILDVAKIIRKKYPKIKIIIAADNDQHKSKNTGVLKATEAAEAVCGFVVKPQFQNLKDNPTDFNDLQNSDGEDAVRKTFAEAEKRASQLDNFELTEDGLFYNDGHGNTLFISDYIRVIAATREYMACTNANYYDDQKNRWARRACGLTPRELLIDRAFETSLSVPTASTGPHLHGQYGKIKRKNIDISVVVEHTIYLCTSKTLKFEKKPDKYKKYDLVGELKYEENQNINQRF
jgi:putative DNA primase/helicase